MAERIALNPSQFEVQEFLERQSLVITSKIEEGHIGIPIYRCNDKYGRKFVIKIGIGEQGDREVRDNLFGYSKISDIGGALLVPDTIQPVDTPWGSAILLSDLGFDFRKTSISSKQTRENFSVLKGTLKKVIDHTTVTDQEIHINGIEETINQLKKWASELVKEGIMDPRVLENLAQLDPSNVASEKAAIMILDFTPDNLFISGRVAKFIDPWRQSQYLGTPIPGLSQFITLSEKIYKIPGFNEQNLQLTEFLSEVGQSIGLTPQQLDAQIKLGSALQYSLSSYVRIQSNPDLALEYANLCQEKIESIII